MFCSDVHIDVVCSGGRMGVSVVMWGVVMWGVVMWGVVMWGVVMWGAVM